jgi:hypothetical protein
VKNVTKTAVRNAKMGTFMNLTNLEKAAINVLNYVLNAVLMSALNVKCNTDLKETLVLNVQTTALTAQMINA